jgi:hypothetical protein
VKVGSLIAALGVLVVSAALVAGCGGSSSSSGPTQATTAEQIEPAGSEPAESSEGGGLPSEAESAATGDIPDNQTFLVFHDPKAGYSIRYPEGWARKGSGNDVTFREKANVVHVVVKPGSGPGGGQPVKTTLSRTSAPDPVTGKRLKLTVDRYEYGQAGKVAVLELETPVGVDNVDAYRMISESFRWQ